jgi:2-phosphosulfolactate phosphatase
MPANPFDQSTYQVRLEWGVEGLARLAPSDIVVVVDVLGLSARVLAAVERGEAVEMDAATAAAGEGAAIARAASAPGAAAVLVGGLRNASAVADAVLAIQHEREARTSIAVVGAPASAAEGVGGVRFAVENQLGAGAVIDALAEVGIDHSSPEAAVAGEGFRALRRATRHLLTASGSGRAFERAGLREHVLNAAAVDAASVVPMLRGGAFVAR